MSNDTTNETAEPAVVAPFERPLGVHWLGGRPYMLSSGKHAPTQPALPERVRSMEGLGVFRRGAGMALSTCRPTHSKARNRT